MNEITAEYAQVHAGRDWDYVRRCAAAAPGLPLIGNGDVYNSGGVQGAGQLSRRRDRHDRAVGAHQAMDLTEIKVSAKLQVIARGIPGRQISLPRSD